VPGIEPGTSGSVARNSDHWTKEKVIIIIIIIMEGWLNTIMKTFSILKQGS
jgi:hypothetical protein